MQTENKKIKKAKKQKVQYSKIIISVILASSIIFIQQSYILAMMGREAIAEDLSKYITKVLIGTIRGYFLKSYSETRSEKKDELNHRKIDAAVSLSNASNPTNPDDPSDPTDPEDPIDETYQEPTDEETIYPDVEDI